MASTQAIEEALIRDFRAQLTADAPAVTHFVQGTDLGTIPDPPGVAVGVLDLPPAFNQGDGSNPGWYTAVMLLDCQSYLSDDVIGTVVRALAGDVRSAFQIDDIVVKLNALSVYNTYYQVRLDNAVGDVEGRIRHLPITVTAMMRPSNEKTTTTTTTT